MAKLDVAARADLALILPGLVLARHLHDAGFLPDLETSFHGACTLDDDSYMRLMPVHGETVVDTDVVDFLSTLAVNHSAVQAASWVHKLNSFTNKNRRHLEQALVDLDVHLTMRTYLVGQHLSVSDLPVWAALRSNPVALSLIRKVDGNVLRWYNFVDASNPWLSELVDKLTAPTARERAQARAAASAAGASYDIDLPDLEGPLVTRFPPEPSGYLHIGHAKAALLNDYFAHRRPGGKLICRFDDTNPAKESMEFQDAILADLAMIGIVPDVTSYSSDYFSRMYDLAVQLIEDGKAFADNAELGKGNAERKNLQPSPRRDMGIAETLAHFADMKAGTPEGTRWCLRARIAHDSPNGTLRDPVIYRCHATPHHRTGTRWHVYPTYDFCVPVLDALEGVTLALRTNEYRDHNVQYAWFQQALGLRAVPIYDFSRMNFVRTLLSKRKLTQIVAAGRVWGWDDPRMPTIRGVLRRGVAVAALREFVLKQGPSRNVLNLEWGAFWALNKKHIDPVAPRHTAVLARDAVSCTVRGLDADDLAPLPRPRHNKQPALGLRTVRPAAAILVDQADAQTFAADEEITLMNWGNAYVRRIERDADGAMVTAMDLEFRGDGDVKKTKKVTWLAAADSTDRTPVDLVSFDYLLAKDKLDKKDELSKALTPVTEFREAAYADGDVRSLKKGAVVQFERKGYFRLDTAFQDAHSRMVFFAIPTR